MSIDADNWDFAPGSMVLTRRAHTPRRAHGAMPSMQNALAGYFRIEAVRPDGRRRLLADWFPNLILDAGLERFATAAWFSHCQVGTGSNLPTTADTQLQTHVAGTSTLQASTTGAQASAPYYGWARKTLRFAQGAAAGNLAEVGVGWATSGAALYSRARILDGSGNPTTITVLSDEFLDVTYEMRLYPPLADSSFQIVDGATTYNCVMRAANVTSAGHWSPPQSGVAASSGTTAYNGAIGPITGSPSGNTAGASPVTTLAYSANSRQRDIKSDWGLTAGNLSGGISAVGFLQGTPGLGSYQVSFSPAIDKTSVRTLTMTHRVAWSRKTL